MWFNDWLVRSEPECYLWFNDWLVRSEPECYLWFNDWLTGEEIHLSVCLSVCLCSKSLFLFQSVTARRGHHSSPSFATVIIRFCPSLPSFFLTAQQSLIKILPFHLLRMQKLSTSLWRSRYWFTLNSLGWIRIEDPKPLQAYSLQPGVDQNREPTTVTGLLFAAWGWLE